jgi:hypothetical protein
MYAHSILKLFLNFNLYKSSLLYITYTHLYNFFYKFHMYIYYAAFYFSLYYYRNDYFHIL